MSRTIKFRGKRVDNGEWVYGNYVEDEEGTSILYRHPMDGSLDRKGVIPESVGQFTGLPDKNGKEIYEGDILSRKEWGGGGFHEPEERYVVETLDYYLDKGEEWGHFAVHLWSEWCEVIGTIYDNPSLLEVQP